MKLLQILKESYTISKVEVLLKTDPSVSKTEVINKIRAVPYVIIVRLREDPRLTAQSTEQYEYTLITIKFLNIFQSPSDALKVITNTIKAGDKHMHKIEGVLDFRPLPSTLGDV
jgi:hypothetical protein